MLSLISPHNTFWHKLPITVKFCGLLAITAALFFTSDPALLLLAVGLAILCYLAAGWRFFLLGLKQIKMIWPFLIIILLWNGVAGTWELGAVIALRMIAALAFANLITLSTQLQSMIDLTEKLFAPLAKIGVPTHMLGVAFAMVIRFTPRMIEMTTQLQRAWRARAVKPARWRITVPLLVAALDDADHVALALRARGGITPPKHPKKDS